MAFSSSSATFQGRIILAGDIDAVFELFSPLGEKLWVPGWDPELLHPKGASWEEGLLFRTKEALGDAVWVVTRLLRTAHEVTYHRVEPGRYVARVDVLCRAMSPGRTEASISYTFVGLSDGGNGEIHSMTQSAYDEKMRRWTEWINAYLQDQSQG